MDSATTSGRCNIGGGGRVEMRRQQSSPISGDHEEAELTGFPNPGTAWLQLRGDATTAPSRAKKTCCHHFASPLLDSFVFLKMLTRGRACTWRSSPSCPTSSRSASSRPSTRRTCLPCSRRPAGYDGSWMDFLW